MNFQADTASDTPVFTWKRILSMALEHRRELMAAHLIAIFSALAAVPLPLLMPLLVDEVLLDQPGAILAMLDPLLPLDWQGPIGYILIVMVAAIVLRLAATLLGVWQTQKFTTVAKDITYRLRRRLLDQLGRISMAEYETLGSGAVASHFVTDMEAVDGFIGSTVSKSLVAVLTLIGISIVLLVLHWQLALFILFLNPVVIWVTVALGKRVKELKRKENSAFEIFQSSLTETLDAIQQIRAANREKHYLARVAEQARGVRDHGVRFHWKSDAAGRLSFVVFLIGFEIFRGLSMLMVVLSDLSIGEMMAVFGYLWFMMAPVQEVLGIQYAWYAAKAALDRLNRLSGLHQEPDWPQESNPFARRHTVGVAVRDLTFRYGEGPAVLNNLSLTVQPGEKVALVGASGGGKSTLVQVLLGLYAAESGTVYFDDVPVQRIGMERVREHVAVVLQHPALFNDTVRNNLSLGRDLRDIDLWQALQIAQLEDTVRDLPEGLDTVVGRQGVRLSGGQRQRLAIARMVLQDPHVVILDEATSALDTETEARVHEALAGFLQGRTRLIVAHRLSAVQQADRALVFEAGQVIEEGSHDELVRNGGLYAKLYGHAQTV